MSRILNVIAREIIDSRGNPTVETEVYTKSGVCGVASVPSGASVGSREALELRDNNNDRFFGKGVKKAVNFVNGPIHHALMGIDVIQQSTIDQTMIDLDGTVNKSKFGANAILSVSLASAKAAAACKCIPLYEYIAELCGTPHDFSIPMPMMNIINGGKHADNDLDFQEFMIIPTGAKTIKKAIRMGSEILHNLGIVLKNQHISAQLGDEGGYAPHVKSHIIALELIKESVERSNYVLGKDVMLAIDCAASELFEISSGTYRLNSENMRYSSQEFTHYLSSLVKLYPIVSIEDGHGEHDWDGFFNHTKILGDKIQLVGDDIFATNVNLLKLGIERGIANAVLVKCNQIGSLTETLEVIKIAKNAGYNTIISHRSGETEDTTIADIAVGTASGQIKTGPIRCSERVSKYNQLIRIAEALDKTDIYDDKIMKIKKLLSPCC